VRRGPRGALIEAALLEAEGERIQLAADGAVTA